MLLMIIFICLVLLLLIYIFAAFLRAQYLTRRWPVESLLNSRESSPDFCSWDNISEAFKKYFVLWVQLIVVLKYNIYYGLFLLNFTLLSLKFSCYEKNLFFDNDSNNVMIFQNML